MPDSRDVLLVRSGTVAGSFLIIDLTQTPPTIVSTDDVIPPAILQVLQTIQASQETIMSGMAAEQAQIQNLAEAISAVGDHVSAASTTLAQWIADHQDAPLDFTPALNALSSLQMADTTLQSVVPQAPPAELPTPVPDPGPVGDPATPPDVPPDLPPPSSDVPADVPPDQPEVNPL